jgi:hypothetical protein
MRDLARKEKYRLRRIRWVHQEEHIGWNNFTNFVLLVYFVAKDIF